MARQRPGATLVALFFALALIFCLAPIAHAQVDGGNTAGTVKDTTHPVEETTDAIQDTLGVPAPEEGPVKEIVDTATKEVDKATGGASEPVSNEVRRLSDENLGPVDDFVGDTLGGARSGGDPRIGSGDTEGALSRNNQGDSTDAAANVRGTRFRRTSGPQETSGTTNEVTRPDDPKISTTDSIVDRATRIAEEVAFPLVLLAMVAAFLVIQSRLDKKDPKLALAPLDVDEQYLSFR